SGIGSSIDRDKIRTISRHFGVCLPINFTSMVCHQFRRARTDGFPIGDGLYGSSGITLSLPSAYQTSDECNSPARFSSPQSYVEATVRNLTKGRRARSTWTRKGDASSSAVRNFRQSCPLKIALHKTAVSSGQIW